MKSSFYVFCSIKTSLSVTIFWFLDAITNRLGKIINGMELKIFFRLPKILRKIYASAGCLRYLIFLIANRTLALEFFD